MGGLTKQSLMLESKLWVECLRAAAVTGMGRQSWIRKVLQEACWEELKAPAAQRMGRVEVAPGVWRDPNGPLPVVDKFLANEPVKPAARPEPSPVSTVTVGEEKELAALAAENARRVVPLSLQTYRRWREQRAVEAREGPLTPGDEEFYVPETWVTADGLTQEAYVKRYGDEDINGVEFFPPIAAPGLDQDAPVVIEKGTEEL